MINSKKIAAALFMTFVIVGFSACDLLNKNSNGGEEPTPSTPVVDDQPILSENEKVTIRGTIECLPKQAGELQTMECAIGMKGDDGNYYGLKKLAVLDPNYKFSVPGKPVEVVGILNSESSDSDHNTVGSIEVHSLTEISTGTVTGTGTAEPDDPSSGYGSIPDEPLDVQLEEPLSVSSVIEHRSALNEKTIQVKGIITNTLLGEDACPPDRGMCAQPILFLADSPEQQGTFYELRMLLPEDNEELFEKGQVVTLDAVVMGSKQGIVVRKAP